MVPISRIDGAGGLVDDQKRIARHYCRGWSIFDFIYLFIFMFLLFCLRLK